MHERPRADGGKRGGLALIWTSECTLTKPSVTPGLNIRPASGAAENELTLPAKPARLISGRFPAAAPRPSVRRQSWPAGRSGFIQPPVLGRPQYVRTDFFQTGSSLFPLTAEHAENLRPALRCVPGNRAGFRQKPYEFMIYTYIYIKTASFRLFIFRQRPRPAKGSGIKKKPRNLLAAGLFFGAPRKIRTLNLLIRSQMLYPVELWALKTDICIRPAFFNCKFFFIKSFRK